MRSIGRRRATNLFDRVAGFAYSQVFYAAVVSGTLARLAEGPATLDDLARRADLPPDGADRLLRACAALRLVEPAGDVWALGSEGASLLGAPGVVAMVAHHRLLYADLADPLALLRRPRGSTQLRDYWDYGAGSGEAAAAYSALMTASQPMIADQLLHAYPLRRHRALLDIGGGEGAFLVRAGAAAPNLRLGLFDLPAVADRAQARFAEAGLTGRVTIHPGSFLQDPLPTGYDCITLNRVLHDHDDAPAAALLTAIRRALPPKGRLIICEPMSAPGDPVGDTYFGLYLWTMGQGRPRSPTEIHAMLRSAGFARSRSHPTPLPSIARLLIAEAPTE